MCGIAGSVWWDGRDDRGAVAAMTRALAHRGPDAEGIMKAGEAVFGHRRLSIIDTAAAANQPMEDPESGLILVYNGEIYNFHDIRAELQALGETFRTRSDTEVLLKSFARWGEAAVGRFNGMFAFALWDPARKRLVLARDRLGKKPLFFRHTADGIVFASELKGLRLHPAIPDAIDPLALGQFLSFNYVLGDRCILAGVEKLPPGHLLVVEPGKPAVAQSYWDLATAFRTKTLLRRESDAIEAIGALVDDAVRLRLVSDVPLGAFLSGGLDSAGIVESMVRAGGASVDAFTIAFTEKNFSELAEARHTADVLSVRHHAETVAAQSATMLADMVRFADEPFADTSMIPVFHLSAFARRQVTVALSGDGGDELFGGYVTYTADRLHRAARFLPNILARAGLSLANSVMPPSFGKVGFDYKLKQFLGGQHLSSEQAHMWWRTIFGEAEKLALVRPECRAAIMAVDPFESVRPHFEAVAGCHYLDSAMYVDLKTWLPDDILVKTDRMSMAHGLEVRAPLLDYRLVELAASLPPQWKLKGLTKKYLFRKVLAAKLPPAIVNRPKAGFNAPVSHWLNGELEALARTATLEGRLTDWLDRAGIERLWADHSSRRRDHGYRLFGLACLGLWLDQPCPMG